MKFHSLTQFTEELARVADTFLADRGVACREDYLLRVEECPVHGPVCARVTYGELRDHVTWRWADPTTVASAMLTTMVPTTTAGSSEP
jgi:hypothetical protein